MKYNPEIHHRRSIRLKDYDYSQAGAYFITICCDRKLHRFGEITVGAGFTTALFANEKNNKFTQNDNTNKIIQPKQKDEEGQPQGIAPTNENVIDKHNLLTSNNGENNLNHINVRAGFTPALFANEQNNKFTQNDNTNKIIQPKQKDEEVQPQGIAPTNENVIDKNNLLKLNNCENNLNHINVRAGFTPALFANEQNNKFTQNDYTNQIIQPKQKDEEGQPQGIAPTLFTQRETLAIMQLNEYGQIAYNEWIKLTERFKNFELDVFQIMPNHIHGIIVLNDNIPNDNIAPTISDIVGSYKSLVANACLDIYKTKNEIMGKFWKRNYYENVIRNERAYQMFSEYIINNPAKWQEDKFYAK